MSSPLLLALRRLEALDLQPSHREVLEEVRSRLSRGRLYVAAVGEFKRGKSTLLNALVGSLVLPTGALPLTNVITLLEHGEPGLTVTFRDGSTWDLPIDQLQSFVSEDLNPGNRLQVRWALVRCPSPFLQGGLVLVDTPGFESLHSSQTQEAREYLPRIDLALFALSVDSPMSAREMALLKDLSSTVPEVILVLNKIDFLSRDELDRMIRYLSSAVERELSRPLPVFPVSARLSHQDPFAWGLAALREHLSSTLKSQGTRIQLSANERRLLSVVGSISASASVELDSLRQPVQVLKDRIDRFLSGVEELRLRRSDAEALVMKDVDSLVARMDRELDRLRRDLPDLVVQRLLDQARRISASSRGDMARAAEEAMDLKSAAQDRLEERGRELTHLLRQLEEIEREISPRD